MFLKKIKKFDGTRSICLFGIPVFSYKKSNSKCLSYLSKLGRVCDSSEYARSLGVTVGKNVQFVIHPYPFSFPDFGSEPYLIEIGDNVVVSFGVSFLTHDDAWYNCSKYINSSEDMRRYGRIKIGNNCFIGCRSILLPGVTIGDNSIIGAGSVVTKDVPSGEVWAGNPARFIKTTDCLAQKFLQTKQDPKQLEYRCLVDCKKG